MDEREGQDEQQAPEAPTALTEEREGQRIQLRCPNCDHPVASVPRGHRFKERHLICPGCGVRIEPPNLEDDGEGSGPLARLLKRLFGG